jgi:hypothetical protein
VALRQSSDQVSQKGILRLFRSRVGRLADPVTALDALKEVLQEVCEATGERERANRLFFETLNFYDGLLQGFDWGWRAARWMRPKGLEDLDRFVIKMLMDKPKKFTNEEMGGRIDRKVLHYEAKLEAVREKLRSDGKLSDAELEKLEPLKEFKRNRPKFKLTDKLKGQKIRKIKMSLGDDPAHWTWKKALCKDTRITNDTRIHAAEVAMSDLRNEAKEYAAALWWHRTISKYYRKHGRIDWARRSAVLKTQTGRPR